MSVCFMSGENNLKGSKIQHQLCHEDQRCGPMKEKRKKLPFLCVCSLKFVYRIHVRDPQIRDVR